MKYLIMKCDELCDQYECDAHRTPITMTDNWVEWYNANRPRYHFEVYELQNEMFVLVKDYEDPMERGMSLHFWNIDDTVDIENHNPTIVEKWINATRNSPIPQNVYALAKSFYEGTDEEMRTELRCCGYIGWEDDKNHWWVYGYYSDGFYSTGC